MPVEDRDLVALLPPVLQAAGIEPSLAGAIVRGESGLPDVRSLALVAVDPPAIQQLLLASRCGVTRKGASDRLSQWDRELLEWNHRFASIGVAVPLYVGGGQGVLLTTAPLGAKVATELQAVFRSELHGELGVAVLEVSPKTLAEGPDAPPSDTHDALARLGLRSSSRGFGALLSTLMGRLRAEKDAAKAGTTVDGRRCSECGKRPGVKGAPDGRTKVCSPCHVFRKHGGAEELVTFSELGQGRVVAYLYVDGSGIGAKLARLRTLQEYDRFSAALRRAFDYESVVIPAMQVAGYERILPILRGGDDLLLVVAGRDRGSQGAFAATVALVEAIERALDDNGYPEVGVGAGLVVTSELQARQGFELAYKLIKSAKTRARREGERSAIDFEVVLGGTVLSAKLTGMRRDREAIARNLPKPWPAEGTFRLYRRPLLLDEARALLQTSQDLDGEGRSLLYRLEEELAHDMLAGLSATMFGLARRNDDLGLRLTGHAKPPLPGPAVELGHLFQPFDDGTATGWCTAIPDLLDLERIMRVHAE